MSNSYPEVCYKKYLGPDWTPDYNEPSTYINHHSSFMDPWVHGLYRLPCNLMKAKDVFVFIAPLVHLFDILLIGSDKGSV